MTKPNGINPAAWAISYNIFAIPWNEKQNDGGNAQAIKIWH